eukprot:3471949-Prymnesium_polylepis.1
MHSLLPRRPTAQSSSGGRLLGRWVLKGKARRHPVCAARTRTLAVGIHPRSNPLTGVLLPERHSSGHTFVTSERFDEVAKAVQECAFTTSELPVVLSLEMHCSVAQQRQLANMMIERWGESLVQ